MNSAKWIGISLVGAMALLTLPLAQASAAGLPDSTELAGYQVLTPSPHYETSVQAVFTVPSASCSSATGTADATVEVERTDGVELAASVLAVCSSGTVSYQAIALGRQLAMSINPGDKIKLVAFQKPFEEKGSVEDLTSGVNKSAGDTVQATPVSASIGLVQDNAASQAIPDFGKIEWVNAQFDGSPIGAASPQGYELVKNPNHPKVLVFTSPLSPAGASFTNTWIKGS